MIDRHFPRHDPSAVAYRLVVLLFVAGWLLVGCGGAPERVWLKAPGWSRGLLVGRTVSTDPVSVAALDDGRVAFLLTSQEPNGAQHLVVTVYDAAGIPFWSVDYPGAYNRIESPRLALGAAGLHLIWIDELSLYGSLVDPQDGHELTSPVLLSGEDPVNDFDVAIDSQGIPLVWYAGPRRNPGLKEIAIAGRSIEAVWVDPRGVRPDIEFDGSGHLAGGWAHHPEGLGDIEFLYAISDNDRFTPGSGTVVASPAVSSSAVFQGPLFALGAERAFVFWTIIERTGLSAGSAQSSYVSFPIDEPNRESGHLTLLVPTSYDLPYQDFEAASLRLGPRVPLPVEGSGRTSFITDLADLEVPGLELLLSFSTRVNYLLRKNNQQIGSLLFSDGVPSTYELISFSPRASQRPALAAGADGNLHLTWVEKGEGVGFIVYYTSTHPRLQETLGRLTWGDAQRLSADAAFGFVTGALLSPVAIGIWGIGPLIVLAVTSFIRRDDEGLFGPGTLLSIAASFALFWSMKPILISGIGEYVPFSAWIPIIPEWLEDPLRIGVPVLIGLLGGAVAWAFTYRIERRSPFIFFIIYAAVDAFLTTGLYGVLFYGAN